MAQLQVPIENDLMRKVKLAALKAGKTLREYVSEVLKTAVTRP